MKTILCYGDSLTWGYDASGPGRHSLEDRWPSVLQAELGADVHVVAEGLNGRTTAFDDNFAEADGIGSVCLPRVVGTEAPVYILICMRGANDLTRGTPANPLAARQGMARLVSIVRGYDHGMGYPPPRVLLVSPPVLSHTTNSEYKEMFAGGDKASQHLAPLYAALAEEVGCGFFDAGTVARTTPLDGVHLDADNSRRIGAALVPKVRELLGL